MLSAEFDQVTEPEWGALLDGFADASLYQTWAYGAVSWGDGQLSHVVMKRGAAVAALAQLRIVKVPVIGRGVAYLRWGPVCVPKGTGPDRAVARAALETIVQEYVHRRRLLLRILPRPFTQDEEGVWLREDLGDLGFEVEPGVRPYRTMRVDLTPSPEAMRKQLDQKWRNQLNGAERNGLEVVEGPGDDLYAQFLALYDEMMARKQFETTVDPREFRRIQDRLPEGQKMWILISRKDGQPMTALVGSTVGDMGIYLLGATSNEGLKTKGSYLLQWTLMQRLKARGCRWYDLGGVNPDTNPGVYHFKQGMGGQEVTGLGRLSLSADALSTASVLGAERVRSLFSKFRSP